MIRFLPALLSLVMVAGSAISPAVAEAKGAAPEDFTATVSLMQIAVTNTPHGASDRYRSSDEEFIGTVVSSSWPGINGAAVYMHNFTNFELVPITEGPYAGTFNVRGTLHARIEFVTGDGILNLVANGKLEGNLPCGAAMTMNFASNGGSGALAGVQSNGKLAGDFTWLTWPPSGSVVLTGKYR